MISLENVVKKFGNRTVLNKISLEVKTGEFATMIGMSGAGKTTLISCLIGAERINAGKIFVDGLRIDQLNINEMQAYRRRIGVVFQDYKLLENKNVLENTKFALEVCGYEDFEVKRKAKEVLEIVGLKNLEKYWPVQLSGGEKQRLSIARALVHSPKLIIADEPTGNLDPKNAFEITKLLEKLNSIGITVLLTTHNKEIVNYLKKRVIKMENGLIVSDTKEGQYQ